MKKKIILWIFIYLFVFLYLTMNLIAYADPVIEAVYNPAYYRQRLVFSFLYMGYLISLGIPIGYIIRIIEQKRNIKKFKNAFRLRMREPPIILPSGDELSLQNEYRKYIYGIVANKDYILEKKGD